MASTSKLDGIFRMASIPTSQSFEDVLRDLQVTEWSKGAPPATHNTRTLAFPGAHAPRPCSQATCTTRISSLWWRASG